MADNKPEAQLAAHEDIPQPLKQLTPEAQRALAEAEARRQQQRDQTPAKEIGGRDGLDPVRFGDWETGGIVSDF